MEKLGDSALLVRFVSYTGYLSSHELADDAEAFFSAEKRTLNTSRGIDQALEKIRSKATWLERDIAGIREYLSQQ